MRVRRRTVRIQIHLVRSEHGLNFGTCSTYKMRKRLAGTLARLRHSPISASGTTMTLSIVARALFAVLLGAQVSLVRAFDNTRYDNVSGPDPYDATYAACSMNIELIEHTCASSPGRSVRIFLDSHSSWLLY